MKKLSGAVLSFCLFGVVSLGAAEIPALELKTCAVAPKIDGVLDDAAWKDAAQVKEFYVIGKTERVQKHRAWVTCDNAWLYVAFEIDQGDMERMDPRYVNGHDDFVQRDDCAKVQFDPGGKASPWYAFKVNRANTRQDRRIQANGANEIESWNIPWKSAVKSTGKNWTVEFAIPFCQLYPFDQLDRARLNLVITTFVPKRDAQGVVVSAPDRTDYSLGPVFKTCFEPEKFALVRGLGTLDLASPPLPRVEAAKVSPYFEKDGKFYYGIDLVLKNYGAKPGILTLAVEDKTADGQTTVIEERVDVTKNQLPSPHRLAVPVAAMVKRAVVLKVLDGNTGEEWQKFAFIGEAMNALDLFGGYLDRNYYTLEKEATAVLSVRLPEGALSTFSLVAEDGNGKAVGKSGNVAAETPFGIPLAALPPGKNMVKIRLFDGQQREMSSLSVEVVKRSPKPGCEWKLDRVNRVLLNNGKPFFAIGFCAHTLATNDTATLQKLKAAGFNFLHLWEKYDAAGMATYSRLFEQEGLFVMPCPDDAAAGFKSPYTVKHPVYSWCKPTSVTYMKGYLCGGAGTRGDRNAAFREYLDWVMPDILKIVDVAKDSPANLGYFIFDEPAIGVFDQGIIGKELYDKINERDGYHPILVNYSSEIPDAEQAVNWMDILTTDPYWIPASPESGLRGTVNWVSMVAARTYAAGEQRRMAAWSIPMCNFWSACIKRGANREEQFCQTYLAAIHGASGIMYFCLISVKGNAPVWNAAAAVARQFADVLGAACVAPAVKQSIAYFTRGADGTVLPVVHDPAGARFADIQMALKRDPQGGYILMAANSRPYPVGCEVTLEGMKDKKIGRYFANDEYPVNGGSFADAYEPYGVRAYRLPALDEPVKIIVIATPPAKIPEPEKMIAWRDDKKNKMPNPSFEETSIPGGLPDYCGSQNRSSWNRTVNIDTQVFKFGKQSVRLDGGYIQPTCVPPQDPDVGGKYVFSAWLKGSKAGDVEVKELGQNAFSGRHINVTTEWQRYEFPLTMRPLRLIFTIAPNYGGTLWVDGLQLERGEKATDFEE